MDTLTTDGYLLPAVFIGFLIGIKVVDNISEQGFWQFLYVVTILGAVFIFIR